MKKLTQNKITSYQKQQLSHYLEGFITKIFTGPVKTKPDLLPKLAAYVKDNSLAELVLKQSIMKGTFSKATWQKQDLINQTGVAKAITTSHPKEQTDVRFFSELITANAFINNDVNHIIKSISFNSEKPQKGALTISRGNTYKDATVNVDFAQEKSPSMVFDLDVKIGNNGTNDIFTGALAPYPITKDFEQHTILNTGMSLKDIQDLRVRHLKAIRYTINEIHSSTYDKILNVLEDNINRPMTDPIALNNLVQQELLRCISLKILHKQPSLFATFEHEKNATVFNSKFFKKLEPYIKPTIFDNKDNFNRFMRDSLKIYNETIAEIAQNIEKNTWYGTGFETIADDIFK